MAPPETWFWQSLPLQCDEMVATPNTHTQPHVTPAAAAASKGSWTLGEGMVQGSSRMSSAPKLKPLTPARERDSLGLWAQGYKEKGETTVVAHAAEHGAPGQAPAGSGAQAVRAGGQHSCPGREWSLTVLSAATEAETRLCSPPPRAHGSVSLAPAGKPSPQSLAQRPPALPTQEPRYPIIVSPCTSHPHVPALQGLGLPPPRGVSTCASRACVCLWRLSSQSHSPPQCCFVEHVSSTPACFLIR